MDDYSVDCPYRKQSNSGRDYCDRFDMETDDKICGGCRVADQLLEEDGEVDPEDLL